MALDESQLIELRHGRPIAIPTSDVSDSPATTSPEWAALTPTGQLAAILREKRAGQLWPHRNFLSAVDLSGIAFAHSSTVCTDGIEFNGGQPIDLALPRRVCTSKLLVLRIATEILLVAAA